MTTIESSKEELMTREPEALVIRATGLEEERENKRKKNL